MGEDKAFARVGGQFLIERVLEAVRVVTDDNIIVTNSSEKYAGFPARLARDVYPGTGALGGIYTGLLVAKYPYSLVVACDMPFLNIGLLQYMAGLVRGYDMVIPHLGEDKPLAEIGVAALRHPFDRAQDTAKARDLHPLHAIYSKQCLGPIERALDRRDLRAIAFLPEINVRLVGRREIDRFDPEHRCFFNANTPEELRYARELSERRS